MINFRLKQRTRKPDIPLPPSIVRAKQLAKWLDCAFKIPFIRKRIGLDSIIGILPGGGDLITTLLSLYILWVAIELNLPTPVLLRMILNIALDSALGFVPVAGKLVDIWWKPNLFNIRLLEKAYLTRQQENPAAVIDIPAIYQASSNQ